MALKRRMDIVANNIANMNTTGFKSEHPVFEDYLIKPEPMERREVYDFVSDIGMYRQFDDGHHSYTGNDLDLAISGPGFLKVRAENGEEFYTRNGSLTVNNFGQLVDQNGYAVLDNGNAEITFPPSTDKITVSTDGLISADENQVGTLGLVQFNNPQDMTKNGNNLYSTDQQEQLPTNSSVAQGYVEASNVNAIVEMQDMISLQRMYEATQRMVDQEHDRKTNYIQRMGRTS